MLGLESELSVVPIKTRVLKFHPPNTPVPDRESAKKANLDDGDSRARDIKSRYFFP
jgi:hypothetical protein